MQDRFKFRFFNKYRGMVYNANNHAPQDTLMQCTSLKDKNGKLIYEGDIVEYNFEDIGKQKAVVYWNEKYAGFMLKPLNDFQFTEITKGEIIGNIYENADLLRGEE